jgi:hypothetical protein
MDANQLRLYTPRDLRLAVDRLRREAPILAPAIKIRQSGKLQHFAEAHHNGGDAQIIVHSRLPVCFMEYVLCHEWAHLIDEPRSKIERDDHSPSWGVAFADVYQRFYGVS